MTSVFLEKDFYIAAIDIRCNKESVKEKSLYLIIQALAEM